MGRIAAPIRLSFLTMGLGFSNSTVAVTEELNEDDERQDSAVEGRWGDLGGKGHLRLLMRRVLMLLLVVDCRRVMMSTRDFRELWRQVELRLASRGVSVSDSDDFSVGSSSDDVLSALANSSSSSGMFSIMRLLTSGSFAAFGGSVGIRGSLLGACS